MSHGPWEGGRGGGGRRDCVVRSPVCQSPSHSEATAVSHGRSYTGHPRTHVVTLPRTPPLPSTYFLPILSLPSPGALPQARTVEMPTPRQPSHT